MSSYEFTTVHPPLLKDLTFGGISAIKECKGPEKHFEMQFLLPLILPGNESGQPWPFTVNGTLTKQKVWVRLEPPIRLSGNETVSITETLSQSYEELTSLRALIGINVSGSYGPVTAEINTEIESTKTQTRQWSKETSHTKTVEREGHYMYADWSLIDRIHINYHVEESAKTQLGKKAEKVLRNAIRKVASKHNYFETYLAKYEDDMPDHRKIIENVFSPIFELGELAATKNEIKTVKQVL